MTDHSGRHDSRTLQTGEVIHLIKHPGSNWGVKSYDWSWFEGQHLAPGGVPLGPKELKWATVYAQNMGWENLRFDTEDEAYAFVTGQIQTGKAPGARVSWP